MSERALFFTNNQFPLIFVLDDDQKAYQFSNQHEYRSYSSLVLGQDIKLIATDNEEHRLMIMKYFDQNNIRNVSVVLFDDMYLSKFYRTQPQSPYTHSDHIPRLSWLAAKALPKHPEVLPSSSDTKLKELVTHSQSYKMIKF